jgi:hypothetical protein
MFLDDLARIRVAVRGLGFNRVVQQTQGDGVNKFMQTVLKQPIILVIGAFLEEECLSVSEEEEVSGCTAAARAEEEDIVWVRRERRG